MTSRLLITALALLLAACDIPGLGPDPKIAQREADAKAIGSACRHALRGIEDCYTLNPKASKTAVFAGWKEMDQYMRENKIEGQRSTAGNDAPAEEIVAEKKPKAEPAEKPSAEVKAQPDETKAKPDEAKPAKAKPGEKPASQ